MDVFVLNFSDGDDSFYYINGKRQDNIQHDSGLLYHLVGHTLTSYRTEWVSPCNWGNPEPWELFEFCDTVEQVEQHFTAHPETRG